MSIETLAYQAIRKRLLIGDLEDDRFHSEASLSKEMNISRSPVRYALKQLEHEGLITYYKNKGIKVRRSSAKEMMEGTDIIFIFIREAIAQAEKGHLSFDFDILEQKIVIARESRQASMIYDYIQNIYRIYEQMIAPLNNETMIQSVQRISLTIMTSTIYNRMESYRHHFESKRVTSISQIESLIMALKHLDYSVAWNIFNEFETYTRKQLIHTGSVF